MRDVLLLWITIATFYDLRFKQTFHKWVSKPTNVF